MNVWQPFINGMPNVIVSQLAIHYPTGKIRASTYGRGLWESDLYVPGTYAPTAAFGSSKRFLVPVLPSISLIIQQVNQHHGLGRSLEEIQQRQHYKTQQLFIILQALIRQR